MSVGAWIAIGLLGGGAAAARFFLDHAVSRALPGHFPFGILAVNVSGAFALGLVSGSALDGESLTIVAGGAIGSYTTFSTWVLDTELLERAGGRRPAVINVVLSAALGFAAFCLGHWIAGL